MEFLDLNLQDDISESQNNFSSISFGDEANDNVQMGGFLSGIFGSSKLEKAVLEAAKLKKFDIVEFFVIKDLISSYGCQDDDGNTLLHYLVSSPNPNVKLIDKVVKKSNSRSYINKQNKNGDTPLILAVKAGQHDLCSKLVECGADRKIKNMQGLHVDTETDSDTKGSQQVSFTRLSPIHKVGTNNEQTNTILDPFLKLLTKNQPQQVNSSEPVSMNMSASQNMPNLENTEHFIKDLQNKFNAESNKNMSGGGCGCNSGVTDTDNLLGNLEKYFNKQSGGSKKSSNSKTKMGKRRIRHVDSAIESPDKNNSDRGYELSRIINNQTEEIIGRTIKMIQTIITDNKSSFKGIKGDEETAKAIKALLWKKTKESHPDIKSPLDIAIEMEKLTTVDTLKEIGSKQIKEMSDVLKKHYEEKSKKMAQTIDTPTSTAQVPDE